MKKFLTALTLGLSLASAAMAETWPARPVTLVVPFPPGGSTDSVARALAPALGKAFNQTFVVENKAGATGTIGAAAVKRSPADGYTFLVTSLGPLVVVPHLLKGLAYDPLKDFDTLTVAVQAPNVLVVPASSPHRSLADVVTHLKANPDKMSFASSGNGSSDHLTAELFWLESGTSGVHVPYKGGGPAISDLLGAQVDASFQNVNSVIQHIRSGKLRALAMTGSKRSPVLPDVPTMSEAGVRHVEVTSWQAVVGPLGLPADVRAKMHAALVAAINDAQIRTQFTSAGLEIVASTPEQFAAFQQQEHARWKRVIETRKITAD
ncbi:Bug family tripartite tricarboxylate transporter substrate binding protein [Sphaerotilus mobilis]|uniref:Tripartite-type tricarboxylate transporter receptor subunit TctC n=1 Tax=Sphaerotilus mobilis TaxID=47994 RepID=A0A4Q7LLY1_9BURK|nr:tripartite tricarboxylate transporter substrate binding protein [Sphaerotilus mobilis]RZS54579.1 tripartite-type tricarboxylate transporter receptor subunit TctC [Sphaerotilus mobilis]